MPDHLAVNAPAEALSEIVAAQRHANARLALLGVIQCHRVQSAPERDRARCLGNSNGAGGSHRPSRGNRPPATVLDQRPRGVGVV